MPTIGSRWRYTNQAVGAEKRVAQEFAFRGLLAGELNSAPSEVV